MYFLIYLADYRWKSLKYVHIHKAFIIDEMYANLYGFPFLLCEFIIICVAIIQVTNSTEFSPKNEKEQNDDGNYNSSKSLCVRCMEKRERRICASAWKSPSCRFKCKTKEWHIERRRKNNCGNDMKRQRQRCWYCGIGIVWGDFVYSNVCVCLYICNRSYIWIYGVDGSAYSCLMAHDDDYYYYYSALLLSINFEEKIKRSETEWICGKGIVQDFHVRCVTLLFCVSVHSHSLCLPYNAHIRISI